jgi:hypothetical protein
MWAPFCAKHLSKMAAILRSLSRGKQPKALTTYLQILSLIPEPKREPYWRMFLHSSESDRIPNIVGNAFAEGVQWRRPSGPGFICGAIIALLLWCDSAQGDDKRAPVDVAIRRAIARKVQEVRSNTSFHRLDERQQVDIERLDGILSAIEHTPRDTYLSSTRDSHAGQVDGRCGNDECLEDPTTLCAKCRAVEYWRRECQLKHWKEHKMRCFETSLLAEILISSAASAQCCGVTER